VTEVARLTMADYTAEQIAARTHVTPRTVQRDRNRARAAGVRLATTFVSAAYRTPRPRPPAPAELLAAAPAPEGNWRQRAGCRDEDPELFFPIGTTGPAERQAEEAKAICRRCAVMADCLDWALDTGQEYGVWGGTGEDERRALNRRLTKRRAGTA
jgi:WhiB family redox-sensing transcriptional regulator